MREIQAVRGKVVCTGLCNYVPISHVFKNTKETKEKHLFIHSGCSNKMPKTMWLIKHINLLLIILEAGKSQVRVAADVASGKSLLSHRWHVSLRKGQGSWPLV